MEPVRRILTFFLLLCFLNTDFEAHIPAAASGDAGRTVATVASTAIAVLGGHYHAYRLLLVVLLFQGPRRR